MTRIGAIRFTIARSGTAASDFRPLDDSTKAQFDVSTPGDSRLSRIAHPQEEEEQLAPARCTSRNGQFLVHAALPARYLSPVVLFW
jgi:hypothetical protein